MESTTCRPCVDSASQLINIVRETPALYRQYELLRTTDSNSWVIVEMTAGTTATLFKAKTSSACSLYLKLSYQIVIGRHGCETVLGQTASKIYSMNLLINIERGGPEHMSDDQIDFANRWHEHQAGWGLPTCTIFSTLATPRCEDCSALAALVLRQSWKIQSNDHLFWTNPDGSLTVSDYYSCHELSHTDIIQVAKGYAVFDAHLDSMIRKTMSYARAISQKAPTKPLL